jgi:hypothetical protein
MAQRNLGTFDPKLLTDPGAVTMPDLVWVPLPDASAVACSDDSPPITGRRVLVAGLRPWYIDLVTARDVALVDRDDSPLLVTPSPTYLRLGRR